MRYNYLETYAKLNSFPRTWMNAAIGKICSVSSGVAFKSTEYKKQGITLVRISNIYNNRVVLDSNSVYLDQSYLEKYPDFVIEKNDVLVALSGATTGKYGIYNGSEKALLNQRVGRLRFSNPEVSIRYIYY